MVLAKLISMNALWVVKISATAFTMQMVARSIEKPITTASVIDKEMIMSAKSYHRNLVMEWIRRQRLEPVI
jgi:hypothetical protein